MNQKPISYDLTPMYENDWNGINGGAAIKAGGAAAGVAEGNNSSWRGVVGGCNPLLGGEPIASGGYGCVFKPALSCKSNPGKRSPGKITKLMSKKYAEREYNEIMRFQKILSSIPNYTHFFLLNDFTLCEPAPLTSEDLNHFDKCRALKKDGINEKNINQSLDKIMALTMPDGGIAVDDYIRKTTNYTDFITLNNTLIELLNKGIVPMNRKHIYHSDIKDSNVLVKVMEQNHRNNPELYTRLIDWGISVEYKPGDKFPYLWTNRPFQFNTPFSIILFTDLFVEKYTEFVQSNPKTNSINYKEDIGAFVMDYIYLWMKKRGPGHYKAINNIFYVLFSEELVSMPFSDKEKIIETNYTLVYIKNYLTEIIYHFSNNKGHFNMESYLNKVFIKLIDVWGFVSIYFCVLEELFEFKDTLSSNEKQLFDFLKKIVLTYLYNPCTKPISIIHLSKDLKHLNQFFGQEIKRNNDTSHFLVVKSQSTKKSSVSKKKRFQTLMMVTKSTTIPKKSKTQSQPNKLVRSSLQTRKNNKYALSNKIIQ
jgi:hypothetical protein